MIPTRYLVKCIFPLRISHRIIFVIRTLHPHTRQQQAVPICYHTPQPGRAAAAHQCHHRFPCKLSPHILIFLKHITTILTHLNDCFIQRIVGCQLFSRCHPVSLLQLNRCIIQRHKPIPLRSQLLLKVCRHYRFQRIKIGCVT